jgi:hypothetical protein
MIRLSGLDPERDIEIRYTGLRPGEKLFEELSAYGEQAQTTHHEKIRILKGSPPSLDYMTAWVTLLLELLDARDENLIVAHLSELVPEYRPGHLWREEASSHLLRTREAYTGTAAPVDLQPGPWSGADSMAARFRRSRHAVALKPAIRTN